jgi:hypothetical protein
MVTNVFNAGALTWGEQLAMHGHVVAASGSQYTEIPEYGPPAGSSMYQMTWSPAVPCTAVTIPEMVTGAELPLPSNAWRVWAIVGSGASSMGASALLHAVKTMGHTTPKTVAAGLNALFIVGVHYNEPTPEVDRFAEADLAR